jgi:hypothetical protein
MKMKMQMKNGKRQARVEERKGLCKYHGSRLMEREIITGEEGKRVNKEITLSLSLKLHLSSSPFVLTKSLLVCFDFHVSINRKTICQSASVRRREVIDLTGIPFLSLPSSTFLCLTMYASILL